MSCARIGCTNHPTHTVKLCCPGQADDGSDRKVPEAAIFIGLALCRKHAKQFDIEAFMQTPTPQGDGTNKVLFEMALKPYQAVPVFERAYTRPIALNSAEARQFAMAKAKVDNAVKSISPRR